MLTAESNILLSYLCSTLHSLSPPPPPPPPSLSLSLTYARARILPCKHIYATTYACRLTNTRTCTYSESLSLSVSLSLSLSLCLSVPLKAGRYRAKGGRQGEGGVKGLKAEKSQDDFAVLPTELFSYTVQPLGPPSVNYLLHSADLLLSSNELSLVCFPLLDAEISC